MKQDLQDKAVEILTQIQSGVQAGADFAAPEIPEIAWSYVLYGRAKTGFVMMAIAVFLLTIYCMRKKFDDLEKHLFFWIFAVFGSVISFMSFATNINDFLMVWLAPKLWLIKAIAGLVK